MGAVFLAQTRSAGNSTSASYARMSTAGTSNTKK
jgi:hypothetical protein